MAKTPIDYKQFSPNGPPQEQNKFNVRWWEIENEVEKASAIAGIVKYIQEKQSARQTQRTVSRRLYSGSTVTSSNGLSVSRAQNNPATNRDRITYNVIQSAIDTVVSKLVKNKPKPMFLTAGGNWKKQRRAQKLEKFVDGIFYENKVHVLGKTTLRDAAVIDTGVTQVFAENGRIKFERVIADELYIDDIEGFYGNPRQCHRVKVVDREVLADLFKDDPEAQAKIRAVQSASADTKGGYDSISDLITVCESWHLPSGPEATDGQHCITINGAELSKEEWEHKEFPFVFMRVSDRMEGFWGQSFAEQLQSIQLEINKLLWVIQRSMHLAGTFKLWISNASKIVKEYLNNDIGTVITGNEAPQYLLPPIVQPELYQHLATLKQAAFEQIGVSQLSAVSQKPAGLDSGKALREFNDIESDRFQVVGQAYENYYLDLARHTIAVARSIYKDDKTFSVNTPGKKFIETINWKDVDLTDDEFVMKLFPVSSLPQTPEGRLSTVQEMMQGGLIDPQSGRRLLDYPDLDAEEKMANAPEDRIHKVLEGICDGEADINDDEDYTPPDEYMPLDLARKLALQYYNHAVCADLPEENLELLRTWMKQIDALEQQMMPPAPPQAPGAPGQAPANPTATPQSDLVPNVNGGQAQ